MKQSWNSEEYIAIVKQCRQLVICKKQVDLRVDLVNVPQTTYHTTPTPLLLAQNNIESHPYDGFP